MIWSLSFDTSAKSCRRVLRGSFHDRDPEFVGLNGAMLISRIVNPNKVDQHLSQSPESGLSVAKTCLLDSIRGKEDIRHHTDLDSDEIEIEVKVTGIIFRNLLLALDKYSASALCCECTCVVSRIGTNCSILKLETRVRAVAIGCSSMHSHCHHQMAIEIPSFLSMLKLHHFHQLAKHSLNSLFIHRAIGDTGNMAV